LAFIQKLISRVSVKAYGCDPYRDIVSMFKKSGLAPLSVKNVWLGDIVKEIIIKNKKN
jgi:hypothetical protein